MTGKYTKLKVIAAGNNQFKKKKIWILLGNVMGGWLNLETWFYVDNEFENSSLVPQETIFRNPFSQVWWVFGQEIGLGNCLKQI